MNRFCYDIFKSSLAEGLIQPHDKIIISLSGGIDSMSLSCLLSDFREKIELGLHWVHFNHGLRPESEGEARFINELSHQKEIPVTIIKTDHLSGHKGMQNQARDWRYENLERIRQELGFNKIALGHHLNDLVETQIWRLLRGGSLFSFNPILKKNLPYIRPLLHITKLELESYLKEIGQDWCEDASNAENDYTRNLIRNELIPIMQTCASGKLEEKLLALDHDAQLLKDLFHESVPSEQYKCDRLAYSDINAYPQLLACELIHRYLLHNGQTEINRNNIELIFKQVQSNRGNWSINLKDGAQISGRHKTITIGKSS